MSSTEYSKCYHDIFFVTFIHITFFNKDLSMATKQNDGAIFMQRWMIVKLTMPSIYLDLAENFIYFL